MNTLKAFGAGLASAAMVTAAAQPAAAREYFVGGPVHIQDMEIVANYLVGVQMAPMTKSMVMSGPNVIHLEADVHATADNKYGYPDGAWVGYLTIQYLVQKLGANWHAAGTLKPMTAKDGPHYADNIQMAGPGKYKVTYRFISPESNGFYHHIDKETGVPSWWAPFSTAFVFDYPKK
ncbi:MAG TPA: iron transporter [Caulobacteraceae bacterium]|jgi:uncharacterized protein involved in high-affinity Fe2+ transport|nr:iron transporter [Caulobacteraceae bacterium]